MPDSLTCNGCNLSPASFRGVPFWVANDTENYGRRIVTHEYPLRDDPFNEDLGEKAQTFTVKAYVVGDDATDLKEAVVAACRQRGPGLLQLPAKDALMVVCTKAVVQRSRDEQCYFTLDLNFTADPGEGVMPSPVPMFEALIGTGLLDAIGPVTDMFDALFNAENVLPYVMDNAVSRLLSFSGDMLGTVETLGASLTPGTVASIITDAIGLGQSAETLVRPYYGVVTSNTTGPNISSVGVTDTSGVVTVIANTFYDLLTCSSPSDLVDQLKTWAAFAPLESKDANGSPQFNLTGSVIGFGVSGALATSVSSTVLQTPSVSQLADFSNAAAFNDVVRVFALIGLASAMTQQTYTSRPQAIQARADLVELFDMQLQRTDDEGVLLALTTARDNAVQALLTAMTSIVPVVTVQAPMSLNSLYWAGRLYNDATRAEELVDRNDVRLPALMPQIFEALAS